VPQQGDDGRDGLGFRPGGKVSQSDSGSRADVGRVIGKRLDHRRHGSRADPAQRQGSRPPNIKIFRSQQLRDRRNEGLRLGSHLAKGFGDGVANGHVAVSQPMNERRYRDPCRRSNLAKGFRLGAADAGIVVIECIDQ
jgi:hypothetical protein